MKKISKLFVLAEFWELIRIYP